MPKLTASGVKDRALELYLESRPAIEIAQTIKTELDEDISIQSIYSWAKSGDWYDMRNKAVIEAKNRIVESNTSRIVRLQEEELGSYTELRKRGDRELHMVDFEQASDVIKAIDVGAKGEQTVMKGMFELQFIQEIMAIIAEEVEDKDSIFRIADKMKALIAVD